MLGECWSHRWVNLLRLAETPSPSFLSLNGVLDQGEGLVNLCVIRGFTSELALAISSTFKHF